MKTPETDRHDGSQWRDSDRDRVQAEVERIGAKTVLEFGPGNSTKTFLDLGIEHITTCENVDKWYEVARDRFEHDLRVRVLKYHDSVPVVVEGLDPEEKFDLGENANIAKSGLDPRD